MVGDVPVIRESPIATLTATRVKTFFGNGSRGTGSCGAQLNSRRSPRAARAERFNGRTVLRTTLESAEVALGARTLWQLFSKTSTQFLPSSRAKKLKPIFFFWQRHLGADVRREASEAAQTRVSALVRFFVDQLTMPPGWPHATRCGNSP